MSPVAKALWFIESHSASELTLEEIAQAANVSRFHLLRAFAAVTGYPVMRYLRGRRLSEAARRLVAAGEDNILAVALDAGYGSHEAFTRAFREQFGHTPEAVRRQRHFDNLKLIEAPTMKEPSLELEAPRFENGPLLLVAGIGGRYGCGENVAGIPAQWQRFGPHIGNIPGQVGGVAYGVCYNTDEAGNMDYLCGVEVSDFTALPQGFERLRIPEQQYAVFFHRPHVSAIRATFAAIWNQWLPQSGREVVDAPFFERYDESFDPQTGNGGVQIWIPIEPVVRSTIAALPPEISSG